jgi:hypothetical protein
MWDNLTALQPTTLKEIQTVLFLCKLSRQIRNLINPREFQEPQALIQCCNEIWEDQIAEEAAARLSGIQSVRYRNEQKKCRCQNQSGTEIRGPGTGSRLRYRMPECRCRRHRSRYRCPAMEGTHWTRSHQAQHSSSTV